ncbi:MAG: thiamine phosphate synthase [Chloroflexi bacterium]|nr:thiamine phosphate synthase [Chloroflexota bacterium]
MLVTDRRLTGEDGLVSAVDEAIDGGVNVVQFREKDLRDTMLLARVRAKTRDRALLILNTWRDGVIPADTVGRPTAQGIHLPEDEWMPEVQPGLIVGRSVHSVGAAERAMSAGADYVVAGPIYETDSHLGRAPAGVDLIRKITEVVSVPVIAIGGIDYQRVPEVMRAGASGVAVISAILGSSNRREAAAQLWNALGVSSP